jgi:acetyl-CoA C-acetyltransferase
VNDAAAAVVIMSAGRAQELGAPVKARILSYAVCGVEPKTMGVGPVPAVRKALKRAGRTLDDVDVIELNEAFVAQSLAVVNDLDLDPAKVNPNRGAIALGHPIAVTGAILTTKMLGEIERESHKLGLVTAEEKPGTHPPGRPQRRVDGADGTISGPASLTDRKSRETPSR